MAYPPMRSRTAELATGAADGRYKQVVKDRGGFVERATLDARASLHDMYYGIHETPDKVLPGCFATARTQNYRSTPQADPWG